MSQFITYPCLQVRPYGLLVYQRTEYEYKRYGTSYNSGLTEEENKALAEGRNTTFYSGQMTDYAKKRLKRAINLLVHSATEKEAEHFKTGKKFKFKVNFITLTLPAPQLDVTDKELKKYGLDNMIKRMKRKHHLNNYVWRAERQKNGNLHFHLITDTYIRYDHIRDNWNAILQRWHFIAAFKEKHGHSSPNSTDVHSVQKVKNLAAYMVKYMTKDNNGNDTIEGKLWDCSKNLKIKHNCELIMSGEENEIWEEAMEVKGARVKHEQLYSIIFLPPDKLLFVIKGRVKDAWLLYLQEIRGSS